MILNQYTKAGRQRTSRGADDQYGGSGIFNIAAVMNNMWGPDSDMVSTRNGVQAVQSEFMKARARLVTAVDVNTREEVMVNPVGQSTVFYIQNKWRMVVDHLPVL